MKQFNLDEYLKNPSKKVITRSGNEVRIVCTDRNAEYYGVKYPILALVKYPNDNNREGVIVLTKEGKAYNFNSDADLFFATEKKEGWINIYKINSIISPGPRAYDTKKEAESAAGDKSNYISTIKIKWEE